MFSPFSEGVFSIVYTRSDVFGGNRFTVTNMETVGAHSNAELRDHIHRVSETMGDVVYVFAGEPYVVPTEEQEAETA